MTLFPTVLQTSDTCRSKDLGKWTHGKQARPRVVQDHSTKWNHVLLLFSYRVQLFEIPWTAARQASLCLTISSPRVCPSSCLLNQWCHPTISSSVALFSFCHNSFPASGSFTNESSYSHQVAKVLEVSLTISLSNESSGLISLRLTGLISLLSKGLKSLLQHHSSKAAILWRSAFLVQLSYPYMTTGKTIALTIRTSVTNVFLF